MGRQLPSSSWVLPSAWPRAGSWSLVWSAVRRAAGLLRASLGHGWLLWRPTHPRSRPPSRRWRTISRQSAPALCSARTCSIWRRCLGLGAVVAGGITLHRRVVVLGGTIVMLVGVACLAQRRWSDICESGTVALSSSSCSATSLLAAHRSILGRVRLPERVVAAWLSAAIAEEESEARSRRSAQAERDSPCTPRGGRCAAGRDGGQRRHGARGFDARSHFGIPEIVVGGLVLAAVTSLPNAVSAVYLARRGRGAAAFSTALNRTAQGRGRTLDSRPLSSGSPNPRETGCSWPAGTSWCYRADPRARLCWPRPWPRPWGVVIIAAYVGFVVAARHDGGLDNAFPLGLTNR